MEKPGEKIMGYGFYNKWRSFFLTLTDLWLFIIRTLEQMVITDNIKFK